MTHPRHAGGFIVLVHTLVVYAWTVGATFIFGIAAILFGFFSRTGNSVHHVARLWAKSILWISGIPVQVVGSEHIEQDRSYIFMSNHQGSYDIPVLLSHLMVQFRWIAKAELFKIPIFGRGMRGAGYISIDRTNRKSAFKSLKRAAESIRHGKSVLVFPEGTRSMGGELLPFKKGGFVLAVDAGVPIIPIIVQGTHAIMAKDSLLIRRQPVRVDILPPLDTGAYNRKSKDDLMLHVRSIMMEHLTPAGKQEASCSN
jgi:1-acyl-sn-glycerol-3-phosphate acyltransferase